MILFFDLETTGFMQKNLPRTDDRQPNIVQLAAILCDENGDSQAELSTLIYPAGFTIPEAVAAIHGVTQERALKFGVPAIVALEMMAHLWRSARTVVAHNIDFDSDVLMSVAERRGVKALVENMNGPDYFCTMRATTPICKLPGKYGDYKWPKLSEAYRHFFGKELENAHDALADVRACRDCYFKLQEKPKPEGATQ